jgi:hypothetical protein
MRISYSPEYQMQFFFERRAESHIRYRKGASKIKAIHGKNDLQNRTLPALERHGE